MLRNLSFLENNNELETSKKQFIQSKQKKIHYGQHTWHKITR